MGKRKNQPGGIVDNTHNHIPKVKQKIIKKRKASSNVQQHHLPSLALSSHAPTYNYPVHDIPARVNPNQQQLQYLNTAQFFPQNMMNNKNNQIKYTSDRLIRCRDRHMRILLLFPGEKRCFFGATMVQCLAGGITIDGYDLKSSAFDQQKMQLVCSPYRTNRPVLFESGYTDNPGNYKHNRLRYRLKELTSHFEEVMNIIGDKYPAVLVLHGRLPANVECIHNLNENLLLPYSAKQFCEMEHGLFFPVNNWKMYADDSQKNLNRFIEQITNKRLEGKKCSIITCAEKGSGKSTFLRYLVNRNLKHELPPVYYLDADVGQTEFTPSGCLSLWKVTDPMLGVPWCHQKPSFNSCLFLGCASPAEDSEKYLAAFEYLLNDFNAKSEAGSLLVINTMGWIKGKGADILHHMLQASRPDLAVIMPNGGFSYKVPSFVPKVLVIHPEYPNNQFVADFLRVSQTRQLKVMKGRELRDLSMISYFASLLPRTVLSSFNEVVPYIMNFSELTFAIPEELSKFKDEDFFGTINVQIVALCSPINDDAMKTRRLLGREYLPSIWITSSSSPPLKCYGYGFIRGVDLTKRSIYVCTPLKSEELSKVSVIARGAGITVPHEFLSSQVYIHVPYLTIRSNASKDNLVHDLYKPLQQRPGYRREYFPCTE